jgi:OFA family oxalate/formate antiporter-like MFS transporter
MSSIKQNKEGLKVLIAGTTLQLFLGIIYVWSVFKAPVSAHYGWTPSDVGLTASFMLCFFAIGVLAGGKLQMMAGVKPTILIGGLMVAAGMLITSLIPVEKSSVYLIYVFYGIAGGFGVGIAYCAIISTAQRWFPENKGFATGVSVCAFGLSAVIFAPFVEMLINRIDVSATFMILSAIFATATLSISSFIKNPAQTSNTAAIALKGKQYTTGEMLKTVRFYLIALSMMFGMATFFVLNPDLKDLAISKNAAQYATMLVMIMGLSNAMGRICIPLLSDKIGREPAAIILPVATALSVSGLCLVEGFLMIVAVAVISFCFGGYAALYPVITSDNFGIKNVGSNYGTVLIGYMVSALIFPILMKMIPVETVKFLTLGMIATTGMILVISLKIINSKRKNE